MKTITNKLKFAACAIAFAAIGTVSAQNTTAGTNIGKKANAGLDTAGGSIKVVDNKGTIKYLQVENGLTSWTDAAPDGGVVTTWQLGGALTSDTTIDINGQTFTIDGAQFQLANTAVITAGATADDVAATTAGGDGYMLLVRDEDSGQVKKLAVADLITGVRVEHNQGADAAADVNINVAAGLPNTLDPFTASAKLFVYRNGVKLRLGTDFNLVAATGPATGTDVVILNAEVPMYNGDIVEIQYIK